MSRPDVLTASKLSPLFLPQLQAAYTVHDRLHETNPAQLAEVAPRIRAIAASGESKVPGDLIARLPSLELISVMGVGYDGVDVAAAKARGVMVTHTPGVLNDDVADLAIALALNIARRIPQADRYVREGRWAQQGPMPLATKMSGALSTLVCTVKLACSGSIRKGGSLATASRSGLAVMVSGPVPVFV